MNDLELWYQKQTADKKLNFDKAQLLVLQEFDKFITYYSKQNFIMSWFKKKDKLGYYIFGSVGRGKTMLMNVFYETMLTKAKLRIHFHEFMQNIHDALAKANQQDDPLKFIAKDLRRRYTIIFLDEMHISDIATAMILQRLLISLFAENIYIVTSSNYHPDGLYPDGMMRERFLPAIATLKENLKIINLDSQQDYRLFNSSINEYFIFTDNSEKKLEYIFQIINADNPFKKDTAIIIYDRSIKAKQIGINIIWFDFLVICGDMRSQLDYIKLSQKYEWFIISDIVVLDADKKDIARRFTWLIDILYDNNCKLALSSHIPLKEIYASGLFSNEFERTLSRLNEMQTSEYLKIVKKTY